MHTNLIRLEDQWLLVSQQHLTIQFKEPKKCRCAPVDDSNLISRPELNLIPSLILFYGPIGLGLLTRLVAQPLVILFGGAPLV